jgi:hypothetical protein
MIYSLLLSELPQYSAFNISYKKEITTEKQNKNNQNLQISKSANAQTCDI